MTTCSIDVILFDFGGVLAEEGFVNGLKAIAAMNGLDSDTLVKTGFETVHDTGFVVGRSDEATLTIRSAKKCFHVSCYENGCSKSSRI
jgi:hypothetical protein